jgi:hypothetical protein
MRNDKEILKIALENVSNLTNEEFDRYQVLQKMPLKDRFAQKAYGGKVSRGRAAQGSAEKNG